MYCISHTLLFIYSLYILFSDTDLFAAASAEDLLFSQKLKSKAGPLPAEVDETGQADHLSESPLPLGYDCIFVSHVFTLTLYF
jgi:hypothetical protein